MQWLLLGGASPGAVLYTRCVVCGEWCCVGFAGITYASFKMLEFEEQPSKLGPGFLSHSKQKVLVLCCPSGEVSVVVAGILPCWLSQDD